MTVASARSRLPLGASFLLFCLSVAFFVDLGPWRALHWANSYDFASLYGAGRAWLHHQNPYDMQVVTQEAHGGGDDPARFSNADTIQPSVYLPTALPLVASIAWLSWAPARLLWACLSTVAFALSLSLLFANLHVEATRKWLLAAGVFAFSATPLGLSHGNPSVVACSLTMLAVYLRLNFRLDIPAALVLGLAHCIKPQISIAAVALFALWAYWRPLLLSFAVPALAALLSVVRAPSILTYGHWLKTLQLALVTASLPGGINDASPANHYAFSIANVQALIAVWVSSPALVNIITWLIVGTLVICYLVLTRDQAENKRLRDMAFFSTVSLTVVYHRFYDEQILLMAVPFLVTASRSRKGARTVVLWLCMLALLLPLHALANMLPPSLTPNTLVGLLLLRAQPLIVLTMCLLLIPWKTGRDVKAKVSVAKIAA